MKIDRSYRVKDKQERPAEIASKLTDEIMEDFDKILNAEIDKLSKSGKDLNLEHCYIRTGEGKYFRAIHDTAQHKLFMEAMTDDYLHETGGEILSVDEYLKREDVNG